MNSEELNWLASRVFSDEHYGTALTNDEFLRRASLEEEYKDEIAMAKLMLEHNPTFLTLSFPKKLEAAGSLIVNLREKREKNNSKRM